MFNRGRAVAVSALLVGLALAMPRSVVADESESPVKIVRVLAVEPSDSAVGRYRIVFEVDRPLPAPRGAMPGVGFWLDRQAVKLPQDPRDQTLLFGYFDELPDKAAVLRAMRIGRPEVDAPAGPETAVVDARTLLATARPRGGEYEASFIRRSADVLDLLSAWNSASVVIVGKFVRRDTAREEPSKTRLAFVVEKVIRGDGFRPGQTEEFISTSREHQLETGARYVLFVSKSARGGHDFNWVRIWWPERDDVLQFVERIAAMGDISGADAANRDKARPILVEGLSSPAAEVRRTAAATLARAPFAGQRLTREQTAMLRGRVASEPSPEVKQAMEQLLQFEGSP